MVLQDDIKKRPSVVFLSSSFVNLAKLFAINNPQLDTFLIIDRRFPFSIEDENLDNFYFYTFNNNKIFERNREKYFDNLSLFINQFEPDIIITNNFTKLLPRSFIEFQKFRNPKLEIINIHHADLSKKDSRGEMRFSGLNADIKQFLETQEINSTLHKIIDEKMDQGPIIKISYPTSLKELKQKHFLHKKEDILNFRARNVVLSYHERTKVLPILKKVILDIINFQNKKN